MKKVLSTALSIFLMLSVVIQTSIVYAEEGKTGSEYYPAPCTPGTAGSPEK